jgi:hypothetical protein
MDGDFESYRVYVWPIELGLLAQPDSPTEIIESELQTTVSFTTNGAEPEPEPEPVTLMSFSSAFSLVSAPEITSLVKSDGYYIRVVTVTEGANTQETDNTTTGIQQSFTTPGLVNEIDLADLSDQLLLSWSTVDFDGGHPVLGYQLRINGELACTLALNEQYCSSVSERMFTMGELELGESYEFEVAAVNQVGIGAFSTRTHQMPPIPTSSAAVNPELDLAQPSKPSRPSRPGSTSPDLLDQGSWSASGSDTDSSGENSETTAPTKPSEGSDTQASGSDSEQASLNWLMLMIALLMSFGLLRVVIRGRK